MLNNMKAERIRRGLTQKQVAEILGVNNQAICKIEKGQRYIRVSLLRKLSQLYDCYDIRYLLENDCKEK